MNWSTKAILASLGWFLIPAVQAEPNRGKQLTQLMCATCHYDSATGALTGRKMEDLPRWIGTVYSTNITQDPETGIAHYGNQDLTRLLRTGQATDGRYSPFMIFPDLSDQDLAQICNFLRSNDPLVRPVKKETPKSRFNPLPSLSFKLPRTYADWQTPRPHPTSQADYGRYLAHNLGCFDCHSRSLSSVRRVQPEQSRGYLAGGTRLRDQTGEVVRTPNLTPDPETGIGSWTNDTFHRALTQGLGPDERPLTFPMPIYGPLTRADTVAIFTYLKTLPAKRRPVLQKKRELRVQEVEASAGLFTKFGCAACHGLNGSGPIADLTNAALKYTDEELAAYIRNPSSFKGNVQMPPYEDLLSSTELAV